MHHEKHPEHGYHLKDAQGRKSVQEVIREQLAANGQEEHFKKVYETIHKLIASNKFRVLRHGDTVFLLALKGNSEAHMNMFNADTPKNLIRNFDEAYKAVAHAGFKTITFESDNPTIVRAAQNLGLNIQQNDQPNGYTITVAQ